MGGGVVEEKKGAVGVACRICMLSWLSDWLVVTLLAALKARDGAAGTGVGLGIGAGIGVGAGGSAGIRVGTGGNVGLGVGAGGSTGLGTTGDRAGLCSGVIVDADADASGAGAKGADNTRDMDEDDVGVSLPGDPGVLVTPLVEASPPVTTIPLEPDGPANAGASSSSNSLSNELEELDEDSLGAVAASNVFHLGFIFCAFFLYSFLPFFPVGGAETPLYVAVPGASSGGRPSLARQRGARRPKSGTAACIGSSFSPPP